MTLISVYTVTHSVCRKDARSVQQPRFWWRHQKAPRERSNYGKLEKQRSCRMELKKLWVCILDSHKPQTAELGCPSHQGAPLGTGHGTGGGSAVGRVGFLAGQLDLVACLMCNWQGVCLCEGWLSSTVMQLMASVTASHARDTLGQRTTTQSTSRVRC